MDDEPKTFAERLEVESNTRLALRAYLDQAHPVVVVVLDGRRVTGPAGQGPGPRTRPGPWARR